MGELTLLHYGVILAAVAVFSPFLSRYFPRRETPAAMFAKYAAMGQFHSQAQAIVDKLSPEAIAAVKWLDNSSVGWRMDDKIVPFTREPKPTLEAVKNLTNLSLLLFHEDEEQQGHYLSGTYTLKQDDLTLKVVELACREPGTDQKKAS